MTNYLKSLLVGVAMVVAGCADMQAGGSKADIDELKAGQAAIRKELAEIKQSLAPKAPPPPVTDVSHAMNVADDPYKGSESAPLTLVEYTDYQCPFCARHAKVVLPEILKNYVDTGKVRYVLRDFPLPFHKQAGKASEAALCAGDQGKYWQMHDELFRNQGALDADKLPGYAKAVGINVDTFNACLASGKYTGRVAKNAADGGKAGVRGTPSFVLGYTQPGGEVKGEKMVRGAVPYAAFQSVIDELLARKK